MKTTFTPAFFFCSSQAQIPGMDATIVRTSDTVATMSEYDTFFSVVWLLEVGRLNHSTEIKEEI